jgi:acetyl-CoA carboxylase biotin carboxyl carrier protein
VLTFEQIKELIELVSERKLDGLEVERAGFRLKIEGQNRHPAPVAGAAAHAAATAPGAALDAPAAGPPAEAAALPPGTHVLNSPIVGTFYRAPAPDAAPFVDVGSRVTKGQVLCIVEAMKLMNEIESDVAGIVVEVYPQNAQAVEFGEPLFAIRLE